MTHPCLPGDRCQPLCAVPVLPGRAHGLPLVCVGMKELVKRPVRLFSHSSPIYARCKAALGTGESTPSKGTGRSLGRALCPCAQSTFLATPRVVCDFGCVALGEERRRMYLCCLFLSSGSQKNTQEILAVLDRSETSRGEDHPSAALSNGRLSCGQQAPSSQGPGPPPRQRWRGREAASPPGPRPQRSLTARQTATLPAKRTAREGYPAQPKKGPEDGFPQPLVLQQGSHAFYVVNCRPLLGLGGGPVRTVCEPSRDTVGFEVCPVPPPQAKAPGPRRVDVPPEEDWRQNSYIPQPGARPRLPGHMTDVTCSSLPEAHRRMLARAAAAPVVPSGGW